MNNGLFLTVIQALSSLFVSENCRSLGWSGETSTVLTLAGQLQLQPRQRSILTKAVIFRFSSDILLGDQVAKLDFIGLWE